MRRNFHHHVAQQGPGALTPRERDVIGYVALGKSNKLIAIELGLSMRTVETHRARIFRKLGVRNAAELARLVYAPHLWGHAPRSALHEPEAGLGLYGPQPPARREQETPEQETESARALETETAQETETGEPPLTEPPFTAPGYR